MIAHAKGGPDTVNLAHTHLEIEALPQGWIRRAGSFPTGSFEEGSCFSTQFRRMSMASILQCDAIADGASFTKHSQGHSRSNAQVSHLWERHHQMNCCNTSTEYEEHCRNRLSLYIAKVITPGKIWSETKLGMETLFERNSVRC